MSTKDLILLALDDEQALHSFEQALAAVPCRISVARDSRALEAALQNTPPVLLVLAEELDSKPGLKRAAAVLEHFPTLPILFFASKDSPALLQQAFRLGITGFISSPLKVEEIQKSVESCLKRAHRIDDWTQQQAHLAVASLEKQVAELQKLEEVLIHIENGVISLDREDRILLVNPAARQAFNLGSADLFGRSVLEVFTHQGFRTLLESNPPGSLPFHEIELENGCVYGVHCTPVPEIGKVITLQDITYLKQIDRRKNEHMHTVSHDLRSPLTAILGYVELIERVGTVTEQQKEFIRRVQTSVKTIDTLVNNLLDLGRLEAGLDIQKEAVPLKALLKNSIETLEGQVRIKQQLLRLELPRRVPKWHGNPIHLQQMLDNLIGNAVKYTPTGGKIVVSVEEQANQVILRVSDSGPGIPPADQLHIFERFYRASNVPDGVVGSGLGLAIVKSIVENHQGRIWVESTPGKGSTFTVVLPAGVQSLSKNDRSEG